VPEQRNRLGRWHKGIFCHHVPKLWFAAVLGQWLGDKVGAKGVTKDGVTMEKERVTRTSLRRDHCRVIINNINRAASESR
jgi:hypothetical protein